MIKVTLEFPSVEAAIATLGKIMVGAPVAQKAAPESTDKAPAVAPAAPATRTRKPRADAGKARGPHNAAPAGSPTGEAPKGDAAPASPSGAAPQTAAPAAPAEGDKPQPSGVTPLVAAAPSPLDAAKPPSEADAQAALEKVFAGKGLQAAQATLAGFGVTRLRDVKPEDRAAFIQAAEKAAA